MTKVDHIEIWLNAVAFGHSNSKHTRYHYKHHINEFLTFAETTPEQIVADYDSMDEKQFKRKYTSLIMGFVTEQGKTLRVSGTQQNAISVVRSFFKYNSLPLNFIPTGRRMTIFHNRDIQKEEIEEVIRNSQPREKAYFALMVQSGLRPNEISNLKVEDFEKLLDENTPIPCMVTIPQESAKGQYKQFFTFCGQESIDFIKEYFKRENREIAPESYVFTQSDKKSPTNSDLISHLFRRTVNRLKREKILDFKNKKGELVNRNELRLYNLRKYFRNKAGAGNDYVNFWMGHALGVDGHYFSQTDTTQHRKIYEQFCLANLRIGGKSPNQTEQVITELQNKLQEKNAEIEKLNTELEKMKQFQTSINERMNTFMAFMHQQQKEEKTKKKDDYSINY